MIPIHSERQLPSTPHNTRSLSSYCHPRRSSCVTRLAVMRLSVSGSVSWRKSLATLDELQTSHPPSVGRTSQADGWWETDSKKEGKKELKVERGTKRLWRLAVTMVTLPHLFYPNSPSSIPRLSSHGLPNCFGIKKRTVFETREERRRTQAHLRHISNTTAFRLCQKYPPNLVITQLKFWFDCLYLAFWVWPFPVIQWGVSKT